MGEPRQHHYVPRFYLNGFADPTILRRENREVIWVYERGKDPRPSSPKNEAKQRDFYSYQQDGSRDFRVEKWLGDVEQQVAPIIASLMRDRRDITESEKARLALFAGTMQVRTPAGRRLAENRIDPLVTKLMEESAVDVSTFRKFVEENSDPAYMGDFNVEDSVQVEELRQSILNGRAEEISNAPDFEMISMIEVGKKVAGLLFEMNWQTIYCESRERFLTSDDPVTSLVLDVKGNRLHLREGVDRPGANVWFPLCSGICVRMSKEIDPGAARWVPAGIRYINKTIIMCANRWIYASEQSKRIKALFDKKGGRFSVESADLRFEGRKY